MIILGLDPGLGTTGWGVIRKEGNRLSHIDNGEIETDAKLPLGESVAIVTRCETRRGNRRIPSRTRSRSRKCS